MQPALKPCRIQWNIGHRPLFFISVMRCRLPSSSSCTCILLSTSPFQVFFGRALPLWPCGIHWSACLAMLSTHLLRLCPSLVHFLRRIWFIIGSCLVFLQNSLLVILFAQRCMYVCMYRREAWVYTRACVRWAVFVPFLFGSLATLRLPSTTLAVPRREPVAPWSRKHGVCHEQWVSSLQMVMHLYQWDITS